MKTDLYNTGRWMRVALLNFFIVALAGVLMRFKINFSLPFVDQKFLLHAHSHFAFTGWVTMALMILMVDYLKRNRINTNVAVYPRIFLANCLTAYGMLVSFVLQGYALFSIIFSTLSIFVSYFFIWFFWRDLNRANDRSAAALWFKVAMVLWAISSLGAFTLAYLMANHIMVQDYYFAAIYFFLHFQYNGWFLFACFGLLFSRLFFRQRLSGTGKKLFMLMAITIGPAYFLSILWLRLPQVLRVIAETAGVLQLLVLVFFIKLIPAAKEYLLVQKTKTTRYLWTLASIAFIIKVVLQMLSVVPSLSQYAFAYRPVVIGYLHLSFLGIISFFILGYADLMLKELSRSVSRAGVLLFSVAVLVQEIVLMCQGLEVMALEPLPHAEIILFFAAVMMGVGLLLVALGAGSHDRMEAITD